MSMLVKMRRAEQQNKIKEIKAEERKNTYQKMFYSNIFYSPEKEDKSFEQRNRSIGKKVFENIHKNSVSFDNSINGIHSIQKQSGDIEKFKYITKRNQRNKEHKDQFHKAFYASNIFYTPFKDITKYDLPPKSNCRKQYNNVKNADNFNEIRKKPLPYKLITGRKLLKERVLTDTLGQKKMDFYKKVKTIQTDRKNNSQIDLDEKFKDYIVKRKPYISDYSYDKYIVDSSTSLFNNHSKINDHITLLDINTSDMIYNPYKMPVNLFKNKDGLYIKNLKKDNDSVFAGDNILSVIPTESAEINDEIKNLFIIEKIDSPEFVCKAVKEEKEAQINACSGFSVFGIILSEAAALTTNKVVSYLVRTLPKEDIDGELSDDSYLSLPMLLDKKFTKEDVEPIKY